MQAQSAESGWCPHSDPSDALSTTDSGLGEVQNHPVPSRPGPDAENIHTEPDDEASGDNPSPGTLAARDRELMPPQAPEQPHVGDHLDLEELRRAYDIYHRMPSPNLVGALQMHFRGVRGDWRFAAALIAT